MKESNQVAKLLIASAVIVLGVPAITSAAPEEAEPQQSLVDALNAGQATAGKAVTLEDFEGGSGREQVFIPGKRADPSASAAAIGQLPIEQQVQAARLQGIRRQLTEAATTTFERQAELQGRSLEARAAEGAADRESRQEIAELSQEGQGQRLDKKLDADREALDKKIEAQLKAAESRGVKITGTQRVTAGYAVRVEDAVAIINVRRVEDFAASVSYSDLDLSTEAGLVTLYSRLQRASNAVCGSRSLQKAGSLRQSRYNKQCYRDVLSKAVAKFNNTKLDEIHAAQTKSVSSSSTIRASM